VKLFDLFFWTVLYLSLVVFLYFSIPSFYQEIVLQDGLWCEVVGCWDDYAYFPDGTRYMIGGSLYEQHPALVPFIVLVIIGELLIIIYFKIKEGE